MERWSWILWSYFPHMNQFYDGALGNDVGVWDPKYRNPVPLLLTANNVVHNLLGDNYFQQILQ